MIATLRLRQDEDSLVPRVDRRLSGLCRGPRSVHQAASESAPEKSPNYESVIAINTSKETVDDEGEATELELSPNNCAA